LNPVRLSVVLEFSQKTHYCPTAWIFAWFDGYNGKTALGKRLMQAFSPYQKFTSVRQCFLCFGQQEKYHEQ